MANPELVKMVSEIMTMTTKLVGTSGNKIWLRNQVTIGSQDYCLTGM